MKKEQIPGFPSNWQWVELSEAESTNNYAMGLVHAGMAQEGLSVFAHHQTKGKGRLERAWLTKAGENIALSVVLEPVYLLPMQGFRLSAMVALSVAELLDRYIDELVCIKWPNDIFIDHKKVAGILIENSIKGDQWSYSVAGIGININQTSFDESLTHAVSIKHYTGKTYSCVQLAQELCGLLQQRSAMLREGKFEEILIDYNNRLFKKDERVKLRKQNIVFEAMIKEVTPSGLLRVETATEEYFSMDEVSWVL